MGGRAKGRGWGGGWDSVSASPGRVNSGEGARGLVTKQRRFASCLLRLVAVTWGPEGGVASGGRGDRGEGLGQDACSPGSGDLGKDGGEAASRAAAGEGAAVVRREAGPRRGPEHSFAALPGVACPVAGVTAEPDLGAGFPNSRVRPIRSGGRP